MNSSGNNYLAYVRVSSYEQAERNVSIPSQIDQINQYAKQNGLRIDQIYKEEQSAFKGKRPIFNNLIKDLKSSKSIRGIIIFKFDRLSRNLDDFLKIDKVIRNKGMEILSVTEPMLNSYLGRYLVRDMQNRAILYSEELSFRIKLGIRKKLQMGGDIGGGAPFGLKRVKGCLVPDENKVELIKSIFQLYSTGLYGYQEVGKLVKEKFKLKNFSWKKVERLIDNEMYTGIRKKVWNLSNEEYLFWGADNPGNFEEIYDLKYITPIISKETFDKCQRIRVNRIKFNGIRTGKAKFPKVFQCICNRFLTRDDKKGIKYLRCSKHINNKFPIKCDQPYTNLNTVEDYFKKQFKKHFLTEEIRNNAIKKLEKEMSISNTEKKELILKKEKTLIELKEKQDGITESFLDGELNKTSYQLSLKKIETRLLNLKSEINTLKNGNEFIEVNKKVINFLKILKNWENKLKTSNTQEKSSQYFSMLFHSVANIVIGSKKCLTLDFIGPFSILENSDFLYWWR